MNNKINSLHKRALRLIYEDTTSTFEELLEQDGSFSVHHTNIQTLAIEMYKVYHGISVQIFSKFFQVRNISYSLRSDFSFRRENINTVYKGENSLRYFAPVIWDLVPLEIKKSVSLQIFISKIRRWRPLLCPCRLCRNFVPNLGFI